MPPWTWMASPHTRLDASLSIDLATDAASAASVASASNAQAGVYDVVVTVRWPTGEYAITSALYRRPAVPSAR